MKRPKNSDLNRAFGTYTFISNVTVTDFEQKLEKIIQDYEAFNASCLTADEKNRFTPLINSANPIVEKFFIDGIHQCGSIIITHQRESGFIRHCGGFKLKPLSELFFEEGEAKEEKEKYPVKVTIEFHRGDQSLAKHLKEMLSTVLIPQRTQLSRKSADDLTNLSLLLMLLNKTEKSKYIFTDSAIESARRLVFKDYAEVGLQIEKTYQKIAGILKGEVAQTLSDREVEEVIVPPSIKPKITYWRGRKLLLRRKIVIRNESNHETITLYYRTDPARQKLIFGYVE